MVHKTETGGPILPSIQPNAGLLIRIRQGTKFLLHRRSLSFSGFGKADSRLLWTANFVPYVEP